MGPSLTGFEFASLCVVVLGCALPVLCISWIAWKTQQRDARTIEKLTAANLALADRPHTRELALAMGQDKPPQNGAMRQPQPRMMPVQ